MKLVVNTDKPSECGMSKWSAVWCWCWYGETWALYFVREAEERWTTPEEWNEMVKDGTNDKMAHMHVYGWLPVTALPDVSTMYRDKPRNY
jgi:arabinogalactan endo-1,4-beta-galactosidase